MSWPQLPLPADKSLHAQPSAQTTYNNACLLLIRGQAGMLPLSWLHQWSERVLEMIPVIHTEVCASVIGAAPSSLLPVRLPGLQLAGRQHMRQLQSLLPLIGGKQLPRVSRAHKGRVLCIRSVPSWVKLLLTVITNLQKSAVHSSFVCLQTQARYGAHRHTS